MKAVGVERCGFGLLQRGHDGAHVGHADLRIVARLGEIAGGPAQHGGSSGADGNLVLAAFDALQHFKDAVVAEIDLVDALELVGDAEALADDLKRDARAARGRLPSAEQKQLARGRGREWRRWSRPARRRLNARR